MEKDEETSYDLTDYLRSLDVMREIETILEETSVLINKIKGTQIYMEYQSALEDLRRHPELKTMADAFRKEKYLAYIALKEPVSFADFEHLEEERLKLTVHPEIERYFKAELALCRVVQEVQDRLALVMSFD